MMVNSNYAAITGTAQMVAGQLSTHTTAEGSVLRDHVQHLDHLQGMGRGAIERTARLADGLFGAQPSPLNKVAEGMKGPPVDPPIAVRMNESISSLHSLMDDLHSQLSRLDRL